jgi:superfamily II RNA helicase
LRLKRQRKRHIGKRPLKKIVFNPRISRQLQPVLKKIGAPPTEAFVPDDFQLQALSELEHSDVLVSAPTGSGKTWIAQKAMESFLAQGQRVWYASPLKALSNAKLLEFSEIFGAAQVGILTGDRKENLQAPLLVGTTEILRNQLYDAMHKGRDLPLSLVILDEAHYLGDVDRGVVWEEVLIYLPSRIRLLLLSATIANAQQIADWLRSIRQAPCQVVYSQRRPVPLESLFMFPDGELTPLKSRQGRLLPSINSFAAANRRPESPSLPQALATLQKYNLLPAIFFLKSRADCDYAIKQASHVNLQIDPAMAAGLRALVDDFLRRFPFLDNQPGLDWLYGNHLAAHHAGLLPHWKLLVESLMQKGLLKAIFSTSTVAAGVNFPARTVVIGQSDRYNGHDFAKLTASDLTQMTGRAGRRGMDKIGFCLLLPGPFQDLPFMSKLFSADPEPIRSQLNVNFSMALNLLLSHRPQDIKQLFKLSLASWQTAKPAAKAPPFDNRILASGLCAYPEEIFVRSRQLRYLEQKQQNFYQLSQESETILGFFQALQAGRVFLAANGLPYVTARPDDNALKPAIWALSLLPSKRLRRGLIDLEYFSLEEVTRVFQQTLELPPEAAPRTLADIVFNYSGNEGKELTATQLQRLGQKAGKTIAQKLASLEQQARQLPCFLCPRRNDCRNRQSPLVKTVKQFAVAARLEGEGALWFQFVRHLEFLRNEGYVSAQGGLTADGRWASSLRISQPMLVAEAIRQNALPTRQPALLAALLAFLADNRESSRPPRPDQTTRACEKLTRTLKPMMERLHTWGFTLSPMSGHTASAIYAWGSMADLKTVSDIYGAGEGDIAQLIYRVADNLRQLMNLGETHPRLAACAGKGVDLLIRPPVLIPA